MKYVHIMVGPSGAGKSTYVFSHRRPGDIVVSSDHYFMKDGRYEFNSKRLGESHGKCLKKFVSAVTKLDGDEEIWIDNTNLRVEHIAPYLSLAEAYGWGVKLVIFDVPYEVCAPRNVHNVPLDTVVRQRTLFTWLLNRMPPNWKKYVVIA